VTHTAWGAVRDDAVYVHCVEGCDYGEGGLSLG
jgi:hypothetical protein